MPIFRKDKEQTQTQTSGPQQAGLPGDTLKHMLNGDYTHGHPGLPPPNYEAPKESRR
jgi:hypothetical protein